MLVTLLCWGLNDGDYFKMLVTFFCILVTFQSVTNIIIWQDAMLVTDIWCWWRDLSNIEILSPTHLVSNIHHQHRCNSLNCILTLWSATNNSLKCFNGDKIETYPWMVTADLVDGDGWFSFGWLWFVFLWIDFNSLIETWKVSCIVNLSNWIGFIFQD